jgi:glycosyltransferase involved in cell wall biosynthesis
VIPTFNEAETIGAAIREIPAAYRLNIIVADSGSTDGTPGIGRIAGARVVNAGRGYCRACALGAEKAHPTNNRHEKIRRRGRTTPSRQDETASPADGRQGWKTASLQPHPPPCASSVSWIETIPATPNHIGIRSPGVSPLMTPARAAANNNEAPRARTPPAITPGIRPGVEREATRNGGERGRLRHRVHDDAAGMIGMTVIPTGSEVQNIK